MIELQSTSSTNDFALDLIRSGQGRDGLVIWAKEQTKGRGRRGRVWISPPGNLHCSMILDVKGRRAEAAQIGFVAAVALVDALRLLMSVPTFQCKWPNDVMADGVKLAGMLLESEGKDWLVLGLGVDVVHAPPSDVIERPATSLALLGFTGSAKEVLERFTVCMAEWLVCWRRDGFVPIRSAWLDRAIGLGGPITVRLETQTTTGTFVDLKDDGALVMKDDWGQDHVILAGDVFVGVTG